MATEPESQHQEASEAVGMADVGGADVALSPSDPASAGPESTTTDTPIPTEPQPVDPSDPVGTLSSPASVLPLAVEDREKDARKDSLSIEPSTSPKLSSNVCQITLLLPTSARHPYKIDEKYLAKRNVITPELAEDGKMDPFSISVYTLKELILREWRPEWDTAPASPGSIRLIFFGKLLDDKMPLGEYNFSPDNSNIVHMTIRPPERDEEEIAKSGKTPGSSNETANCGCCVVS